jgi:hypothetical protein
MLSSLALPVPTSLGVRPNDDSDVAVTASQRNARLA